ncbi:MAG: aldehyde ferredoxin oxidoreductase N-terminal domain-containing protein [Pseudomonadota bacterium]
MTPGIYGWCGRILKVNLTNSTITELETMDYAERFLGGRGIATRIYWEHVAPDTRAFDPENCMILMSGPLGATGAQGASRFEVVSKSPMLLPEGFCYGNLGGFFAPALKKAGYDGVVVTGRAERPSYIWINDGRSEIRDASSLWGKGVYEVREIFQEWHGKKVHFVTTGVAGENRCRTATMMTDHEGSATGGFGAVMGSKNLKAIAVVGTGRPSVARREELADLIRRTIDLSKRGTLRMPLPKEQIRYVGKASCYQCGLDCLRGMFKTASGKEAVRKCHSMVFYMPWVFTKPGETMDTAVDATAICNDLSLCTMEMDNVITWLERCYRSGYLTEKDTGLDISALGSREFFEKLTSMIAHRQGFGNTLAEGILRVGERLGEKARAHFTENMSGVGLGGAYSPREYIIHALLYALEPRQPIAMLHEVSYMIARWLLHRIRPELSPTTDEVFRSAATKFWGSDRAWDLRSYEGKALATVLIQDRTYVKDSLVLCDCAWPIMDSFNTADHVGDPALESKIFSAVTGIETDEAGLNHYGERIFNLQRAILLREGWKAKESDVPAEFNFTDPLQTDPLNPRLIVPGPGEEPVSVKGNVLDRKKFEEMRDEFYELRGWDPRTGLQRVETLERLDLSDVALDLRKRGLIS